MNNDGILRISTQAGSLGYLVASAQHAPPSAQAPLQELAASQDAAHVSAELQVSAELHVSTDPQVTAEPQAPAVHCVAAGSIPGMKDK